MAEIRASYDLLVKSVEHTASFPYMADVSKYERITKVGQGTFGEVFKAKNKKTGQVVALKKILMENEKEGFPITALREIKMLKRLKDPHVTELLEICSSKASSFNRSRSTFYLVFTFCEHDLAGILANSGIKFAMSEIKALLKQMFEGLYKIHANRILHRDMKAANVLITKDGILKLADFGLARPLLKSVAGQPEPCYTNRVVTLWYRPPELLLGQRQYNTAIDLWGAGCIMAELWTRSPIMQGDSEQRQIELIQQLCGSVGPEAWPGVERLPLFNTLELKKGLRRRVKERLTPYVQNQGGVELIDQLLSLDPRARPDADKALDHKFFWTDPMPSESDLRRLIGRLTTSMFEFTAPRHASKRHHGPAAPAAPAAKQPVSANLMHSRIF